MKTLYRYFLYAVLLCSVYSLARAQHDQGGYIAPSDSLRATYPLTRVIFLPSDGFTFFQTPNGEFAGRITPGFPRNAPGAHAPIPPEDSLLYASISRAKIRPTYLDLSFFFETSDDRFFIPFTQRRDGYVQIEQGAMAAWIAISDIEKAHFRLVSWMEFYGKEGTLVVPPPQTKRTLRRGPYADAEAIVDIEENYFEVRVITYDAESTTCCEGSFCYVRATRYKVPPCLGGGYDASNIVGVYEGWLQCIDDKGQRLVHHNAHGC